VIDAAAGAAVLEAFNGTVLLLYDQAVFGAILLRGMDYDRFGIDVNDVGAQEARRLVVRSRCIACEGYHGVISPVVTATALAPQLVNGKHNAERIGIKFVTTK